jgi:hypothetical protein
MTNLSKDRATNNMSAPPTQDTSIMLVSGQGNDSKNHFQTAGVVTKRS